MNTPKKKIVVGVGALVTLALVVCGIAGCGSSGGSSTTTSTTEIPGLPPDPGEAGKATLAGIDSDHDGVRDDIQRYIAITYPNSAKTRAALTQGAKVMQDELLDANNKEKSILHAEESDRVQSCLWYVFGSVAAYGKVLDELQPIILNTDARNKAYFTYDDQLGGQVFSAVPYDQRATACNFDVTALPN